MFPPHPATSLYAPITQVLSLGAGDVLKGKRFLTVFVDQLLALAA